MISLETTKPEERLKMAESACICRNCPTYKGLEKDDDNVAYCSVLRGRSKNIKEEKGCTCGLCKISQQMKFVTLSFCTRGIDREQQQAIADANSKGHSVWEHIIPREHAPR